MASNTASIARFTARDAIAGVGTQVPVDWRGAPGVPFLRFDDSNPEYAVFMGIIPNAGTTTSYGYTATTGIKVTLWWSSEQKLVTGAVRWGVNIVPVNVTDLQNPFTDIFSSTYEVAANSTVSATAGNTQVQTHSVSIANIQGAQTTAIVAKDLFLIRVRRVADNAGDTLVGDACLFAVYMEDY